MSVNEQICIQKDAPILMQLSLNDCLSCLKDQIEIGDIGSKIKVTMTWNVIKERYKNRNNKKNQI